MESKNPYASYVTALVRTLEDGRALPLGGMTPPEPPALLDDARVALIFAPHPDDECAIGGLPLRLRRELGFDIVNVAVTQGSRADRRAERWREVSEGCVYLGFGLEATADGGLSDVTPRARRQDGPEWQAAVDVIARILSDRRPDIIFFPHDDDWNRTHLGTHLLIMDALERQPTDFACKLVETEFWGAMDTPNLMIESSAGDVADLIAALSCHAGEVRRNPYHLRLPAWMIDNVRRGSELVLGQGQPAPDFTFATLYRLRAWREGAAETLLETGQAVAALQGLSALFPRSRTPVWK